MTVVSLVIAAPLGIFAAIYLVEYAKKGSRLVNVIRITAETLSGIPSIVFGLFGMLFFVTALEVGNVPACRCIYDGDHDPSTDHAYIRGSIKISSYLSNRVS